MKEISLKVEASYGLSVKVGDVIEAGMRIGNALDNKKPLKTPMDGTVKSIVFDSKDHSFVVVITAGEKSNRR